MDDLSHIDSSNGIQQPVPQKGPAARLYMGDDYQILSEPEISLLKEILSIPTYSGHEHILTRFIKKYSKNKGYLTQTDRMGNVYITKGNIGKHDFVPLLNAHSDSVFRDHLELIKNNQRIDIIIENDVIKGFHPITKNQMGVGMDDKNGIYISLMVLDKIEKGKVIFTTSEEVGMKGVCFSIKRKRNEFYNNIGYILAIDSPEVDVFSDSFFDGPIFNRDSEFFIRSEKIIKKHIPNPQFEHHPWTCMVQLRNFLKVQGFNCPASYYNYHTGFEYSLLGGIQTTINMCVDLIKELGNKKYKLTK